jgi:hypothetical protein
LNVACGISACTYIGAVASIVIAIILMIWLPESIRFLFARDPILTGVLVGLGYKVGGIFYAAALPCFIGALFLMFLYIARPVMQADAEGTAAPAR